MRRSERNRKSLTTTTKYIPASAINQYAVPPIAMRIIKLLENNIDRFIYSFQSGQYAPTENRNDSLSLYYR